MKRYQVVCLTLCLLLPLFLLAGCGEGNLLLNVSGEGFTVTNAEGRSMEYADGAFSGDMTVNDQQTTDVGPQGFAHFLTVPYSGSFTYQCKGVRHQSFGIMTELDRGPGDPDCNQYSVTGSGLDDITITPDGEMTAAGYGGFMTASFSMPCAALEAHGFVSFSGAIGASASVQPYAETGLIRFSGFLPGDCTLSYAGAAAEPLLTVTLEVGSGTIDLTGLAGGVLTIQEDGCEVRSIDV